MKPNKKIRAKRIAIIKQLSDMSRNSWAGAKFEDYHPLELALRAIDERLAEKRQVAA